MLSLALVLGLIAPSAAQSNPRVTFTSVANDSVRVVYSWSGLSSRTYDLATFSNPRRAELELNRIVTGTSVTNTVHKSVLVSGLRVFVAVRTSNAANRTEVVYTVPPVTPPVTPPPPPPPVTPPPPPPPVTPPPAPVASLAVTATPSTVTSGQSVTIAWISENITGTCTVSNGSQTASGQPLQASYNVPVTETMTVTVTCGSLTRSATVTVTPVTPQPPPPPPPTPEPPVTPPPTSPSDAIFTSYWTNSVGSSNSALSDGGKWKVVSYSPNWGSIVSKTTSGVPTTGTVPVSPNVLRVAYNNVGNVEIVNRIPTLTNNQTLSISTKLAVAIRNSVGNLSGAPHHPLQFQSGNCASQWSLKIEPRSNGTFGPLLASSATYPNSGWNRTPVLNKNQWYTLDFRFTRVSANQYRVKVFLNGQDDSKNWIRYDGNASQNLQALNPIFPITDACARHLFIGNNDPGWSGVNPSQDFIYWGDVEVRVLTESTTPTPPVTPPTPPAGGNYPNRPSNFTRVISDYGFDDAVPTNQEGKLGSSGWVASWNSAGLTRRATASDAPRSPTSILEWAFTQSGTRAGNGVGNISRSIPNLNRVYVAFWMKHDANFQWHPISNKLIYLEPGNIILQSRHWENYFTVSIGSIGADQYPQINTNPTGKWVFVEYLVDAPGRSIRVWADGVLVTNYSGTVPSPWNELKLDSTWGGGGSTKSGDSFRWFDHIFVATTP